MCETNIKRSFDTQKYSSTGLLCVCLYIVNHVSEEAVCECHPARLETIIIMSMIGGKSIEHNASIIGTNFQHNQRSLYKTNTLHRIVRFH